MKQTAALLGILILTVTGGCSGAFSSPLLGIRVAIDSPLLDDPSKLPVVYPYRSAEEGNP